MSRRFHRTLAAARRGFNLVELLVVLAVLAILVALLLPAVQAARESARVVQCKNRLKQLGLAMDCHVSVYGRYPSNGWGHLWIGVPDRGTGQEQPGGWIYNVLPYLEQEHLREMGQGMSPADQRQELARLMQVPLPQLTCPTRAAAPLSAASPGWLPRDADWVGQVAKNDYAVNGGDIFLPAGVWEGPLTLEQGDADNYPWIDRTVPTGICFQRSQIKPSAITDGLSQTYLIGEKHVSRRHYDSWADEGYNESLYHGSSLDITRWVLEPPRQDSEDIDERRFGSAHLHGCHFVYGDGSVRMSGYHVDAEVHRRLGNRCDSLPIARH